MSRTKDAIIALVSFAIVAIAAACFVALVSCADCHPSSMRCVGDVLEVCDGDGQWETGQDCADVLPGLWACCEGDGGAECAPEVECSDEQ
jgi:hypothetical protein